ncbi:MAG: outer membrane protein assembly factor BamB family protein [Planctomycetota bacterium]
MLTSCLALAGENGKLTGTEWPQFKGSPGFTGVSADASVRPPLKLIWSYHTGGDGAGDGGAGPTVAGGKLFVPIAAKRSVLALDADTGEFLWEYTNFRVHNYVAPSYAAGRVYLWLRRCTKPWVVALDAETGKEVWKAELDAKGVGAPRTGLPVADGRLYCVTGGEVPAVLALDVKDGKGIWRTSLKEEKGLVVTAPCVAGGRVFLGASVGSPAPGGKGSTLALDATNGKILWRNEKVNAWRPPASDGKVVALSTPDPTSTNRYTFLTDLHLLDAETGKSMWKVPKVPARCTPTLTADKVMTKTYGPNFHAFARRDGKKLWSFAEKGASGCCTPVVSGRYAYFGIGSPGVGGAGFCVNFKEVRSKGLGWGLFAIDLETGKQAWRFQTGYNVCSEPTIAYGRLYAVSRDGRVYCFAPAEKGEPTTPETRDKSANAPAGEVKRLLAAKLPVPRPGRDWPMFGGAPARAGLPVTLNVPLNSAWQVETGGRVNSEPAIVGGRVYAGSDSGKILCVDGRKGSVAWKYDAGARVRCSPAVAGGIVYCGADDGKLYALGAADGKQKWVFETGGAVRGSPAVVGDVVFFGADDHNVYALNRKTGVKLWSYRAGYYRGNPPAVHGDSVYVAEGIDWAVALEVATGKPRWRTFMPKSMETVVYRENRLWVRGFYTAELDSATGKILRYCSAPLGCSRPTFMNDFMLVSTQKFLLNEVNPWDLKRKGTGLKRPKRGPRLSGGPRGETWGAPLILGDKICFASTMGEVVLTTPDGNRLWSSALGGRCRTSPVAADGLLVVGCDDGKLYAFRSK